MLTHTRKRPQGHPNIRQTRIHSRLHSYRKNLKKKNRIYIKKTKTFRVFLESSVQQFVEYPRFTNILQSVRTDPFCQTRFILKSQMRAQVSR